MEGFAFNIGDMVTTKEAISEVELWRKHRLALPKEKRRYLTLGDGVRRYPHFQIIERIMQECPGGIQRHYKVQTFSSKGYQPAQFLDIELAAIPEADPNALDE